MTLPAWLPLIEGLANAVWIVDPASLRVVAVNPAATDLLGVPAATLVGKAALELAATPEDVFFWEEVARGQSDRRTRRQALGHQGCLRGIDQPRQVLDLVAAGSGGGGAHGIGKNASSLPGRGTRNRRSRKRFERSPVGAGPSGKMCPRCEPHRRQRTSVRTMP